MHFIPQPFEICVVFEYPGSLKATLAVTTAINGELGAAFRGRSAKLTSEHEETHV